MSERTTGRSEASILKAAAALRQHAGMTSQERSEHTSAARAAFERKWLDLADGDPVRAAKLRKAFYLELSVKSARARRRAKEQTEIAEAAEAELDALDNETAA